jgi:uncharacterized protein (TIGR03437 family)
MVRIVFLIALTFPAAWIPLDAAEPDALAISANIQARHMPYGTILDPVFAAATSDEIVGYTRCGDSALWTGAYMAAEAFRYKVTQSPEALDNVRRALAGLKSLADVTGDNRLARCMVPADSPYAAAISSEEAHNTVHQNPPWIWLDNTSRDQVVGAFFGLGATFDLIDDQDVKNGIADLATRVIGFVAGHLWSPNNDIDNTFEVRPEELQMLLQVARHVNPSNRISGPFIVAPVNTGVRVDVRSDDSYFKFNLDFMTFYNLVRLQDNGDNRSAYQLVRNHVASHRNAFFNVIDRALNGPDDSRDAETRTLLDEWLARPSRDFFVDLSQTVPVCGGVACNPIPVPQRTPADFLWQVSPFQLSGGLTGTVEGAGIDYILPYWMARYYGVITPSDVTSAAAQTAAVAPGELASVHNLDLTAGAVGVTVTDAGGATLPAQVIATTASQVNFVVPEAAAAGVATFTITSGDTVNNLHGMIQPVAPALFAIDTTGRGAASASAAFVSSSTPDVQTALPVYQCGESGCTAVPIDVRGDGTTFLTLAATGVRNRTSLDHVIVTVNGLAVPLVDAGPTPDSPGLDQVIVALPASLAGIGQANVAVTVDGQPSNVVTINLR